MRQSVKLLYRGLDCVDYEYICDANSKQNCAKTFYAATVLFMCKFMAFESTLTVGTSYCTRGRDVTAWYVWRWMF
jgi:hypothetical protein